MELRLRAPAKINLGLEILSRRADGYHEIETVFLPLEDLYDEIELERSEHPGIELTVHAAPGAAVSACASAGACGVPAGPENLAHRAGREALELYRLEGGLRIRLEKHIPVAAGLGGGSSDAAAVLLGVTRLARPPAPTPTPALRELARRIGADVPFFLEPRPALGRGIGDELTPLSGVPELTWLLVAFAFGISTPQAYAAASAQLTLPRRGSSIAALLGRSGVLSRPPNDLERAARHWHPEIGSTQGVLMDCGASIAGMSGSGPTVYGLFEDREHAERAAERAGPRLPPGARTLVVRSAASA